MCEDWGDSAVPEALRFETFEQAYRALSQTEKSQLKARAKKMARGLGPAIDKEDLYNATIVRCLRVRPWPSDVATLAVFNQLLHYTRLDFLRKTIRSYKLISSLAVLQKDVDATSLENAILAKDIVRRFLDSLTPNARKVARGRILGIQGEELRKWACFDEATFEAASREYQRKLLRIR